MSAVADQEHFGERCGVFKHGICNRIVEVSEKDLTSHPHVLFYGPSRSLKQEYADEFVRRITGSDYPRPVEVTLTSANGVEFPARRATRYIELDLYAVSVASNASQQFGALLSFLRETTSQANIMQARYVFVIRNMDCCVNRTAQAPSSKLGVRGGKTGTSTCRVIDGFRNLLEKRARTALFVLIATNISRIPPSVASRCLNVRCPIPTSDELNAYFDCDEDGSATTFFAKSRGLSAENPIESRINRLFAELKAARSTAKLMEIARAGSHELTAVSPSSGELHNALLNSILQHIRAKKSSAKTRAASEHVAVELTARLDTDILSASKPLLHYEKYFIDAKTILL